MLLLSTSKDAKQLAKDEQHPYVYRAHIMLKDASVRPANPGLVLPELGPVDEELGVDKAFGGMTKKEQEACRFLGWSSAKMWDGHDDVEISDHTFDDLTDDQKKAVLVLGM